MSPVPSASVLPSTVLDPVPEIMKYKAAPDRWCGGLDGICGGNVIRVRFMSYPPGFRSGMAADVRYSSLTAAGAVSSRSVKVSSWRKNEMQKGRRDFASRPSVSSFCRQG